MNVRQSILRKWIPWVFLLAIPMYVINASFTKILKCPSCYLFEDSGDGLKNYFALNWYVLHDDGLHFSGMNAPYGDHILFSDNQPILAVALRFVHHHIFDLTGHTIGIVNILLLFSLLFTVFILYLVLRQLALNRYFSVAFAIIITFLSPQLSRFLGHYSLAYTFIIPLYLLLLFKFQRTDKKWKWALLMLTLTVVAGLLHLYHFLMLSVFIFFYGVIQAMKYWQKGIFSMKSPVVRGYFVKIMTICIVPAILLLGGMKLTDNIHDRPVTPYRAHGLNVKFNSTFIPMYGPFGDYWKKTFNTTTPHTESWSYVSLVGLLLLPAALIFMLKKRAKKNLSLNTNAAFVHSILLAATFVWILAAGILYSPIFSWILDLIPKLKQFRGLARLSWIFYYVFTIFIAYYLARTVRYLKFRKFQTLGLYLTIAAIILMSFEAYFHAKPIFAQVSKDNNYLNVKLKKFNEALFKHGLEPKDFQAILMLPMISLGSENVGIARGNWTMRRGIQAANELGIPLIDYSLSRTSVSQTLDFIQLLSSDAVEKVRLKSMTDKPILLLAEVDLLTDAEKRLLEKATFIESTEQVNLYSLLTSDFDFDPDKWANLPDTSEYTEPVFFKDFESDAFTDNILGSGVKKVNKAKALIATFESQEMTDTPAEIHLWIYIDHQEAGMSVLRVKEIDPSGQILSDVGIHRDDVDWSEVVGHWIRLDRDIILKTQGHTYEFYIDVENTIVDALQVRKKNENTLVKSESGTPLFLNGIKFPE